MRNPWSQPLVLGLLAAGFIGATLRSYPWVTVAMAVACVLLFAVSYWAANVLLGRPLATAFAALAVSMGWFAEQMGSSRGWFFGRYHYTEVLGLQLGNVPLVIPLMWFALCFVGYVLACLLLWRQPVRHAPGWAARVLTAVLAAMLVTAFDLGADPYFVYVLKAWVMVKTDGGWFGETLQGFAGWMLIASIIVLAFQVGLARWRTGHVGAAATSKAVRMAAGVPLGIYASALVFQLLFGHPIETRAVALFAMGIPLLAAAAAWWHWAHHSMGEKIEH